MQFKVFFTLISLTIFTSCVSNEIEVDVNEKNGKKSSEVINLFNDPEGILDLNFASNGVYNDNTSGFTGAKVALQSDGKIVIAGYDAAHNLHLRRYTKVGILDSTFGTNGEALMINSKGVSALHIDANGKLLVMSTADITRFNTDGSIDNSFGTNGSLVNGGFSSLGMVIDSNNNYWLAGHNGGNKMVLSEVNSITSAAKAHYPLGNIVQIYGVTIDSSDNIYPVGIISNGGLKGFIAKVKPSGVLDLDFGPSNQGWLSFNGAGGMTDAKAAAVNEDGSIIVTGVTGTSKDVFIAKIQSNGTVENNFGPYNNGFNYGGFSGTSNSHYHKQGWSIAILDNGKVLVSGTTGNKTTVAKYGTDGEFDSNFADNGIFTLDVGSGDTDVNESIAVNLDGTFLITGFSSDDLYLAKIK